MKDRFLFFKLKNFSDPDSFAQLYDMYVKKIYRFIYFKVGSEEEAQDLTSTAFLKAWQYLSDEEATKIRNLRAFLYRIARNLVIDHYRVKGVEQAWVEPIEDKEIHSAADTPLESVNRTFDNEAVMAGIKGLKPLHQEVVLMRYVEDMDINEIAEVINKTGGATRVIIHRALQELKDILDESI